MKVEEARAEARALTDRAEAAAEPVARFRHAGWYGVAGFGASGLHARRVVPGAAGGATAARHRQRGSIGTGGVPRVRARNGREVPGRDARAVGPNPRGGCGPAARTRPRPSLRRPKARGAEDEVLAAKVADEPTPKVLLRRSSGCGGRMCCRSRAWAGRSEPSWPAAAARRVSRFSRVSPLRQSPTRCPRPAGRRALAAGCRVSAAECRALGIGNALDARGRGRRWIRRKVSRPPDRRTPATATQVGGADRTSGWPGDARTPSADGPWDPSARVPWERKRWPGWNAQGLPDRTESPRSPLVNAAWWNDPWQWIRRLPSPRRWPLHLPSRRRYRPGQHSRPATYGSKDSIASLASPRSGPGSSPRNGR